MNIKFHLLYDYNDKEVLDFINYNRKSYTSSRKNN